MRKVTAAKPTALGRVKSIAKGRLVLYPREGQDQGDAFLLSEKTVLQGKVKRGSRVVVVYEAKAAGRVALEVRAKP